MPESGHGDWVVAIASVVAAIIGGVVIFLFDRYRAARRVVRFVIETPQAVSQSLRSHGSFFEIKVGDRILQELNVASVTVKNAGNVPLDDVSFDVIVPGAHSFVLADCITDQKSLKTAVKINFDETMARADQRFSIFVPFLNPGETFEIKTFSDLVPSACRVECRLPGVAVEIDTERAIAARSRRWERFFLPESMIFVLTMAILVAASYAWVVQSDQRLRLEIMKSESERENLINQLQDFEKRREQTVPNK
jgi:hypothetical protein